MIMSKSFFNELFFKRRKYNNEILDRISLILNNTNLRFNQLMYIINEQEDYFNEEPWETLKRIDERLNLTEEKE